MFGLITIAVISMIVIFKQIDDKAIMSESTILPFKFQVSSILICDKDTITLLGYKDVASGLPVFKYTPQVLRSTNGGFSWKETLLDTFSTSPAYYQVDSSIFLYAYDKSYTNAKVYASSDAASTWKLVGTHTLSEMSIPIFGDYLRYQQTADMLRSVAICEEWDCSNFKTLTPLIIAKNTDNEIKNEVGSIDLKSGDIKRISTGKFHFSEAIFADNNTDWILGRIEGDHGIFLIHNNKGSVELVAHWPNKSDIKFGGDQPQDLYVKGNLIAVAVAGAPFYGTGYLYYSVDGGNNWVEKELSTSNMIKIAVNENDHGLLAVCVNMMSVSIFDIPLQIDSTSTSK